MVDFQHLFTHLFILMEFMIAKAIAPTLKGVLKINLLPLG